MSIEIKFYKADSNGDQTILDYGQFDMEFKTEQAEQKYVDMEAFESKYGFDYESAWTKEIGDEILFFDHNENDGIFTDEESYRKFCKLSLSVEEIPVYTETEEYIRVVELSNKYMSDDGKVKKALDKVYDRYDQTEFDREQFQKIINSFKTLSFLQDKFESGFDIVEICY